MTHVFSSMYLAGLLLLSAATASAATFNAQILAGLSQHFTVAVEAKAAQAFKKAATP